MRLLASLLLVCAAAAQAQSGTTEPGVRKGSAAPAFSLEDQSGKRQSLESLMGEKGLMLVFVRSADW